MHDPSHFGLVTFTAGAALAPDERRQHPRYATDIAARCLVDGAVPLDVRIVDISDGGFGLDRALRLDAGSPLTLDLPGVGQFACTIAWTSLSRCGLKLLPQAGDLSLEQSELVSEGLAALASR